MSKYWLDWRCSFVECLCMTLWSLVGDGTYHFILWYTSNTFGWGSTERFLFLQMLGLTVNTWNAFSIIINTPYPLNQKTICVACSTFLWSSQGQYAEALASLHLYIYIYTMTWATDSNFRRTSPVSTKLSNSTTFDEPVIQTRKLNIWGWISCCALSLMSVAVGGQPFRAGVSCEELVFVFLMPYVTFLRTVHSFLGWHQLLQYYYQGPLKILPSPLSLGWSVFWIW